MKTLFLMTALLVFESAPGVVPTCYPCDPPKPVAVAVSVVPTCYPCDSITQVR